MNDKENTVDFSRYTLLYFADELKTASNTFKKLAVMNLQEKNNKVYKKDILEKYHTMQTIVNQLSLAIQRLPE